MKRREFLKMAASAAVVPALSLPAALSDEPINFKPKTREEQILNWMRSSHEYDTLPPYVRCIYAKAILHDHTVCLQKGRVLQNKYYTCIKDIYLSLPTYALRETMYDLDQSGTDEVWSRIGIPSAPVLDAFSSKITRFAGTRVLRDGGTIFAVPEEVYAFRKLLREPNSIIEPYTPLTMSILFLRAALDDVELQSLYSDLHIVQAD